jgi:hypothetical protein
LKTPNDLQIAAIGRRLIENPQIAVDLLLSLQWALRRIETAGLGQGENFVAADVALHRASVACGTVHYGNLANQAAHYAKELARDAAGRTGEELLPEHLA